MKLRDKIAVVTGGTSGIGLATVRALRDAGAWVAAVGRGGPGLARAAVELGDRGEAMAADVSDPESLKGLMDRVKARRGGIDVLVVNAGVSDAPAIAELDVAAYDRLMDVNAKGAAFALVHALPLLADGAAVVFVGSVAAGKGTPGDALYAASKGFVRSFARTAAFDPDVLARRIRINVVEPGPIATALTRAATDNPDIKAYVEGLIPMGRWGRAEECAQAILFLASDAASFITGVALPVDGGMSQA
jgi:NAD(P)-dependent dehydrogenase (short-subunit alcohol dehydrogenase family)